MTSMITTLTCTAVADVIRPLRVVHAAKGDVEDARFKPVASVAGILHDSILHHVIVNCYAWNCYYQIAMVLAHDNTTCTVLLNDWLQTSGRPVLECTYTCTCTWVTWKSNFWKTALTVTESFSTVDFTVLQIVVGPNPLSSRIYETVKQLLAEKPTGSVTMADKISRRKLFGE